MTRLGILSPCASSPSTELQAATSNSRVQVRAGQEYLVKIRFDGEKQRQRADFRPALPLVFRW